jgi:hypothetical protein
MNHRKYYLLNYIFIFGITLLFLNDHLFKWQFSNWVTGKLSDFIGLLILPFLLSFIFPKHLKLNVILTGVFFVFWKSPFSQEFINFYNSISFIEITRVVDYSDYIALLVLPFSYSYLRKVPFNDKLKINKVRVHPLLVLIPSVFVFMATSPPYWHGFEHSEGNIQLFKTTIKTRMSQEEILKMMDRHDIKVSLDTTYKGNPYNDSPANKIAFYNIKEIILDNDTINNLKFSMVSFKEHKTKIFINSMAISKEIENDKVKNELRKYYRKLMRKYIKESIKK